MLAGGLDSIKNKMALSEPAEGNLTMRQKRLVARGVDALPSALYEAIQELKKNRLMRDVLVEHLYRRYIHIKTREWNEFKMQVTQWERETYLDI